MRAVIGSKITPALVAGLCLLLGIGAAVAGVYVLAGLGWALLALSLPLLGVAAILIRGLIRVE